MSIDFQATKLVDNRFEGVIPQWADSMNVSNSNAFFILECLGIEDVDYCGAVEIDLAIERLAAARELCEKRPDEITGTSDPATMALVGALRGEGARVINCTQQDAPRMLRYLDMLQPICHRGKALGATHLSWA